MLSAEASSSGPVRNPDNRQYHLRRPRCGTDTYHHHHHHHQLIITITIVYWILAAKRLD